MTDWTKVKKINGTWGDFEKYNFIVVHKLLPTEEADRLHKYLLLKREAFHVILTFLWKHTYKN